MGGLISRFRKPKSIKDQLAKYDQQIKDVEVRQKNYKNRWTYWQTRFLFFFVIAEIAYSLYFYFLVYKTKQEPTIKLMFGSPILLLAVVYLLLRRFLNFYFSGKVKRDALKLATLKEQQKKHLEKFLQDTEFLQTKALLEQYSETIRRPNEPTDQPSRTPARPPTVVQRRPIKNTEMESGTPSPSTPAPSIPAPTPQPVPVAPVVVPPPQVPVASNPVPPPSVVNVDPARFGMRVPDDHRAALQRPSVPPPPKDPNRPWYDKVVDFLVGDAPDYTPPIIVNANPSPASNASATPLNSNANSNATTEPINPPASNGKEEEIKGEVAPNAAQ